MVLASINLPKRVAELCKANRGGGQRHTGSDLPRPPTRVVFQGRDARHTTIEDSPNQTPGLDCLSLRLRDALGLPPS